MATSYATIWTKDYGPYSPMHAEPAAPAAPGDAAPFGVSDPGDAAVRDAAVAALASETEAR